MNEGPSDQVIEAITRAAGRPAQTWQRVTRGGYTPAERWLVTFADGTRGFAKVGTVHRVGQWLKIEHRVYAEIVGEFMPRLIGWSTRPVPALLIEDLSGAHWPPPWSGDFIAKVRATLESVAATPCPEWVPRVEQLDLFGGWSAIVSDPEPFLALGLASKEWLFAALPALIASEHPSELAGNSLLHLDVRSDNICLAADRVVLVDWNFVSRGNPLLDVAGWLPSLTSEGGPLPEVVDAAAGIFAPAMAGYFCSHASLPIIPDAPAVREVQLAQAVTSLCWAARWLGLAPPDGPRIAGCA
jgi:hypothetical protein